MRRAAVVRSIGRESGRERETEAEEGFGFERIGKGKEGCGFREAAENESWVQKSRE